MFEELVADLVVLFEVAHRKLDGFAGSALEEAGWTDNSVEGLNEPLEEGADDVGQQRMVKHVLS